MKKGRSGQLRFVGGDVEKVHIFGGQPYRQVAAGHGFIIYENDVSDYMIEYSRHGVNCGDIVSALKNIARQQG